MKRNWVAGGLGALGLALIGYAGFSEPEFPPVPNPRPLITEHDPLPEAFAEPGEFPGAEGDAELAGHELPPTGALASMVDEETAGEVPLFESARLAAPRPVEEAEPARPVAGSFETVASDHWIAQALQEVFPLGDGPGSELPEEVTRFELAVALARSFEYYEQRKEATMDVSKVALMEKLGAELRQELSMLGVDASRVASQLEAMTSRVSAVEQGVNANKERIGALEKRLAEVSSKLASQRSEHVQLAAKVDANDSARQKLEKRTKASSEVLSRLVVKTSITTARMGELKDSLAKGVAPSGPSPDTLALARRVDRLEREGVPVAAGGDEAPSRQLYERLKRLERLVVKVYDRRAQGKAGTGGLDTAELTTMRTHIGQLAQRLEGIEQRGRGATGNERAIGEVKGMLKNFLSEFQRRLNRVERQVF